MRLIVCCVLALVPALASAQWNSDGRFEVSFSVLHQLDDVIGGDDTGEGTVSNTSSLSLDSAPGFSLGFGYHVNQYVTLGFDFEYLQPDYDLVLIPDSPTEQPIRVSHEGSQFNTRFKGTFTLNDEGFTPYFDLGFGWTQLDTNVVNGDPLTGCWWHPWWGYICQSFYDTFTETEFTYGAGAGLQLNTRNGNFFKLGYSHWVLDAAPQADDFALASYRLEFGRRF
jgi:opacity protein-like surface antigen